MLISCTEKHQLELDGQKPFSLIIRNIDENKSKEYVIQPDSKEYKLLNKWLKNNREGWNKGPYKWLSPFELYAENYRLQFSNKSAIIKVKQNNKNHMWRKKVDQSLVDIFKQYENT